MLNNIKFILILRDENESLFENLNFKIDSAIPKIVFYSNLSVKFS